MVSDAECLGSGVGGRMNVEDTPDAVNCQYRITKTDCVVIAIKSLGGPHHDSRVKLFMDSYGDGDFPCPKGSRWRPW